MRTVQLACVQCTLVHPRAGYMYDAPDPAHLCLVPHRASSPDHDLASGLRLKLFSRHSPGTQYPSDEIKLKEGGINTEGGMVYLLLEELPVPVCTTSSTRWP